MKSSIYGILDRAVEVTYFPYPFHDISDTVTKVDSLPDIVDGVIFRVRDEVAFEAEIAASLQESIDDGSIDLTELQKRFDRSEANKNRQLFSEVSQRTSNVDSYENAFSISEEELSSFYDDLAASTETDIIQMKTNLLSVLTHDHASANIEAFVRDGLGIEGFNIDSSLKDHVSNTVYLSYVQNILTNAGLSPEIITLYLTGIVESMKLETDSKRKSTNMRNMVKRYRSELDNPVGVVDESAHSIGHTRLGSKHGIRKEDRP